MLEGNHDHTNYDYFGAYISSTNTIALVYFVLARRRRALQPVLGLGPGEPELVVEGRAPAQLGQEGGLLVQAPAQRPLPLRPLQLLQRQAVIVVNEGR